MAHIVIACRGCGIGGSVGTVAYKQARELSKHFERVTLVSDTLPQGPVGNARTARVSAPDFHSLRRFGHVPGEIAFTRAVCRCVERLHSEKEVDLFLGHSHALGALAGVPLKRRLHVSTGMVTHGDIFERPPGAYSFQLTTFYKMVTPRAYARSDLVVTPSPSMASWALRGGACRDAVRTIPNGIDLEDIGLDLVSSPRRHSSGEGDGTLKILYVGALSAVKGVEHLVSACRILEDRRVDFRLGIIGKGPMEKRLRRLTEGLERPGRVQFLGAVERKRLGGHYRGADLTCVPSVSDSLPTVVLESLASGTPVVGSEVGGIPFMVQSGWNGVIVPKGDAQSLAEALERLYRNSAVLDRLRGNARPSVIPRFSWEVVGMELQRAVRETLGARSMAESGRTWE